jgi:hypothetical protein
LRIREQYEELFCPFCDKGMIQCSFIAGAYKVRSMGRGSLGKGKSVTKSNDYWIIKSGCPVCGKTAEEVEKKLKELNMI